jgi:hypothetical protein
MTRVLLGLAGLLGVAFALPAVPAAATGAAQPGDVQVHISSFSPVAPKPGDTVTITGTATNTGTTLYTRPQAIACAEPGRIDNRAALASLSAEGDGCKGLAGSQSTAYHDFSDSLEPGVTKQFKITVPWNQWEFGSNGNGVYVVGVRIFADDPNGGRATRAITRTLMPVVAPDAKLRKVRAAMVLALRHRPTQLAGTYFADESLLDDLDPEQGRLSRLIRAGDAQPVTWVIDPSLLDEARRLADGYRTDGTAGVRPEPSPVARDWLVRLDQAIGSDPVVMLPYADPDVRTLVDAKLDRMVTLARDLGAATSPPGRHAARTGFWLDPEAANASALAAAAGPKTADTTLLSNTSWPAGSWPTGPMVRIDTSRGPVTALVADQALMSGGPDPVATNGPIQLRQRLAAETALLALDTGGSANPAPVSVAVVPGRNFDTLGTATGTLLQALRLPWVTPVALDQLESGPVPTVTAPDATPAEPALSPSQLDTVRQIDDGISTYTAMLATQAGRYYWDRALLRSTSLTWRGAQAEGDKFRKYQLTLLRTQFGKVRIVSSDGPSDDVVTLSASKGRFPLTVANDLTLPVRVGLRIESLNREDLRVEPIEPARIRGGNRETFEIRASAQANGVIRARVHLITQDGRELGKPLELDIRAAQYGTVGWVLVGSAVALLFGTSAIRIYRRIRNERRAAERVEGPPPAKFDAGSVVPGPSRKAPAEPAVPAATMKSTDV